MKTLLLYSKRKASVYCVLIELRKKWTWILRKLTCLALICCSALYSCGRSILILPHVVPCFFSRSWNHRRAFSIWRLKEFTAPSSPQQMSQYWSSRCCTLSKRKDMTVIDLDAVIDLKASSGWFERHLLPWMPKMFVCMYLFIKHSDVTASEGSGLKENVHPETQ